MLSQRQTAACSVVALVSSLAFFVLTPNIILIILPFFLREEVVYAIIWFVGLAWPISLLLLVAGSLIAGIFAYRFTENKMPRWSSV
jgi:hypothetical protein